MDLCDINAKINVQNADEAIEKLERINALLKELHENLLRLGFVPCCETETGERVVIRSDAQSGQRAN